LKNKIKFILCLIVLALICLSGCQSGSVEATEIAVFPVDSAAGILTKSNAQTDREISNDGNGSVRLTATEPTTFRLYETGDLDIENARLIYQAKVRTDDVDGQVYLEMWCQFDGRGEYFSRALHAPISGTVDWTSQQTPFLLKRGENPDNIRLNLVVDGTGTAWIDDIRLVKSSF
jgi:hypothetical protein